MSRILVTGGCGFIGSHLTRALLKAGHDVVVLDDLSGGFVRNLPDHTKIGHATSVATSGCEFVKGSVVDDGLVDQLFRNRRFDYVYHLAAYAAEGLSHFIRRFNYTNNLIGSANIVNACVKHSVRRLVFTSSIAVYGHGATPFTEKQQPHPIDPYGVAKLAVEQDLHAAMIQFGLDYTIFRPHNVYGEYQHIGDRYRNVVGIFMNQLLRGEPLTVFGDGEQKRCFSYVNSVIDPMDLCLHVPESAGRIYNVGGDLPYTVNWLAEEVQRVAGIRTGVKYLPRRNEVDEAVADHSLAASTFGRIAGPAITVGLEKMWAWAKDLGPQEPSAYFDVELEKGLPEVWRRAS